jgi:hypothetical protein
MHMPTMLKSANSKATSKGLSFSTCHKTTTWPPMYFLKLVPGEP